MRLRDDPQTEPPISLLGFDAFRELPSPRDFAALVRARSAPMKALLLDQSFAAGVGNWIADEVLYQARIALPSNVQTGRYTAETFAITRGRVIASASAEIEVHKLGFERVVADFADEDAFWYGLIAVALSLSMGWIAGRLFAFI